MTAQTIPVTPFTAVAATSRPGAKATSAAGATQLTLACAAQGLPVVFFVCILPLCMLWLGRAPHGWLYDVCVTPAFMAAGALAACHTLTAALASLQGTNSCLQSRRTHTALGLAGAAAGCLQAGLGLAGVQSAWAVGATAYTVAALTPLPVALLVLHTLSMESAEAQTSASGPAPRPRSHRARRAAVTCWSFLVADLRHNCRTVTQALCPSLWRPVTAADAAPRRVDTAPAPGVAGQRGGVSPNEHQPTAAVSCLTLHHVRREMGHLVTMGSTSFLGQHNFNLPLLVCLSAAVVSCVLPWLTFQPVRQTDSSAAQASAHSASLWSLSGVALLPIILASVASDSSAAPATTATNTSSTAHRPGDSGKRAAATRLGMGIMTATVLLHLPLLASMDLQSQFLGLETWALLGSASGGSRISHVTLKALQTSANGTIAHTALRGSVPHAAPPSTHMAQGGNPWSQGTGTAWGSQHSVVPVTDLQEGGGMWTMPYTAMLVRGSPLGAAGWHLGVSLAWLLLLQGFATLWERAVSLATAPEPPPTHLLWPGQYWFYVQYYTLLSVPERQPMLAFCALIFLLNVYVYLATAAGWLQGLPQTVLQAAQRTVARALGPDRDPADLARRLPQWAHQSLAGWALRSPAVPSAATPSPQPPPPPRPSQPPRCKGCDQAQAVLALTTALVWSCLRASAVWAVCVLVTALRPLVQLPAAQNWLLQAPEETVAETRLRHARADQDALADAASLTSVPLLVTVLVAVGDSAPRLGTAHGFQQLDLAGMWYRFAIMFAFRAGTTWLTYRVYAAQGKPASLKPLASPSSAKPSTCMSPHAYIAAVAVLYTLAAFQQRGPQPTVTALRDLAS